MSWRPKKLTTEQLAERRREGGRLLLNGRMSDADIARHLGVSQVAVYKWKKLLRANDNDLRALDARPRSGAPSALSPEQWQQLKQMILAGAVAAGYEDERWTLRRVRTVVEREFGVRYSLSWLSDRLRELGLSPQRPQIRSSGRDAEATQRWIQREWPRIKKKPGEAEQ